MRAALLVVVATLATSAMGCGASTPSQPAGPVLNPRPRYDPLKLRLLVGDPSSFVAVDYTNTGSARALEVRVAATGKVLNVLEGPRSVDYQGGALSADGRYLYVARATGWIDQIMLSTRARQHVARGQNPAISPNGDLLAYGDELGDTLAVRDVRTRMVRTVNLAGPGVGPDDSIAWLGDSATLVLARQPTFSNSTSVPQPQGNCGDRRTSETCLIVVDAAASHSPTVRMIAIPGRPGVLVRVAGVDTTRDVVLIARAFPGGRTTIARVVVSGARARVLQSLSLGERAAVAFSPTGRRIIYQTVTPRALWSATIGEHQLTHVHRLTGVGFWGAQGTW